MTSAAITDVIEIGNLIAEYAWLVDRWDVEGIVDLFSSDGEFDLGFGRVFRGPAELTELYAGLTWVATSHHCSQPRITVDGNRAQARCTMYAMHRAADGSEMELWGVYSDELIREDGRWRIRRRMLRASLEKGGSPAAGQASRFEPLPRGARFTA